MSTDVDPAATRLRPLHRVFGQLTAANVVVALAGFAAAPIQARALGPDGRGALAAIAVPLTFAPLILGLGLSQYATRQAARGRALGPLLGSVGALVVALGFAGGFLLGPPAAAFIADGRDTVETYLRIGFLLLPIGLLAAVLYGVHGGLERWNAAVASRVLPVVASLVAVIVLAALHKLTVASAAVVAIAAWLSGILPLLGVFRGGDRLRVDPAILREAIPFGLAAWVATLGTAANFRLDQVVMARVVDERELGLYAVAVTIAASLTLLTSELSSVLFPRVAAGDHGLPARALRMTLPGAMALALVFAAVTPPLLDVVFGKAFADAAPMVWVLLGAMIPLAGVSVLAASLTSAGHPRIAATGEIAALVVTVVGLVVLLDPLGGLGAAIVSAAAYSVNFALLLAFSTRRFGGGVRAFLVPGRGDVAWLRGVVRQLRSRGGPGP